MVPLAELREPCGKVEGLIVANEPVPLDLLPVLRIVANFGVGYDRVDVAACAARGVAVTNTPGVLDDATADLAFALILAVRRRVAEGDRFVRTGGWSGSWSEGGLAEELTGSTLGILGLGRIGSAIARRAHGFELRVLYSRRLRADSDLGEYRRGGRAVRGVGHRLDPHAADSGDRRAGGRAAARAAAGRRLPR